MGTRSARGQCTIELTVALVALVSACLALTDVAQRVERALTKVQLSGATK